MRSLRALDSFAVDHHGLVTVTAFMKAGFSRSTWYRVIESGELDLIHPGWPA